MDRNISLLPTQRRGCSIVPRSLPLLILFVISVLTSVLLFAKFAENCGAASLNHRAQTAIIEDMRHI